MSKLSVEEFEKILKERLECTHVQVFDESGGCGSSFKIIVVSKLFEGKKLLERQRLVNEKISEEMKNIHALTMKTWTPEQYEQNK
jgi:stress-induced morphogen